MVRLGIGAGVATRYQWLFLSATGFLPGMSLRLPRYPTVRGRACWRVDVLVRWDADVLPPPRSIHRKAWGLLDCVGLVGLLGAYARPVDMSLLGETRLVANPFKLYYSNPHGKKGALYHRWRKNCLIGVNVRR